MSFGSLDRVGSSFAGLPSLEPETGSTLKPHNHGSLACAANPFRGLPSLEPQSRPSLESGEGSSGTNLAQRIIAHVGQVAHAALDDRNNPINFPHFDSVGLVPHSLPKEIKVLKIESKIP